jgi:hypothetical protein
MSASRVAPELHRARGPAVPLIVAAFAIGALIGVGVQGALDRASASTLKGTGFQGVSDNNMSDAANAAVHAAQTPLVRFQGVSDNNMGDAAARAMYGPRLVGSFMGVSDNNMSDAARRATYADAR